MRHVRAWFSLVAVAASLALGAVGCGDNTTTDMGKTNDMTMTVMHDMTMMATGDMVIPPHDGGMMPIPCLDGGICPMNLMCCPAGAPCAGLCVPPLPMDGGPLSGDGGMMLMSCTDAGTCSGNNVCCMAGGCTGKCVPDCRGDGGVPCPMMNGTTLTCNQTTGVCN